MNTYRVTKDGDVQEVSEKYLPLSLRKGWVLVEDEITEPQITSEQEDNDNGNI